MKTTFIFILLFVGSSLAFAQGVGVGTISPDESAALDIVSTTRGVLVPRMTSAQRVAIDSAATGLLVFDMTTKSFWFKGNAQWIELIDSSNTVVHKNGANIFMGIGGFVGVGTNTPSSKLDVTTPLASEGISHSDGNVRMATSTTADMGRISTTSNHPLFLSANNAVAGVLITPVGFVGIGGVIAPIAALEVKSALASAGIRHTDGNVTLGSATTPNAGVLETVSDHALHLNASGGPNHLVITPVGLVGVGTVSPTAQFEVKSPLESAGLRHTDGNVTLGTATTPNAGVLETVSDHALHLNASGGPNHLVITPVGLVGVGTVSPTAQFEVKSPLESAGLRHTDGNVTLGTATTPNAGVLETVSDHALHLNASGGPNHLVITPSGLVGVGTGAPLAKLDVRTTASAPGLQHSDGVVTMVTKVGSGVAKLTTSTNHPLQLGSNNLPNQLTLATNGNVGIGTATANGDVQFSNDLTNRKIVLYEHGNNDHEFYGLGVNPSTLRYQVDRPSSNHVFYSATSPTTSTELMRIAGNGNVGVKVSAPGNRMDIHSGMANRTGTHASNRPLYVTGDLGEDINGIEFRHANGAQGIGFGYNTIYSSGSDANQDLAFKSKGTGDLVFKTNTNERMRVTDNGNVGIGQSNPHAQLQLGNSLANRKVVLWEDGDNDHQYYGIGINPSALRYQVSSTTASHVFHAGTSPTESNELMRITGGGNVGIGTITPAKTLDVNGDAGISGNLEAGSMNVGGDTQISGQLQVGYGIEEQSQNIPGLTGAEVSCSCPPNSKVIGGGYYGSNLDVYASKPSVDGSEWLVSVTNLTIDIQTLYVYAICARIE